MYESDLNLPFGNMEFFLDAVTFITMMGDAIIQGLNVFIVTGKASFSPIINGLDLECHVGHLPINFGNDPSLHVNHVGVVSLNILDLQSIWSTLIKQEVARMTDLSLSLEDLLKNLGNHVGSHTKTLLDR